MADTASHDSSKRLPVHMPLGCCRAAPLQKHIQVTRQMDNQQFTYPWFPKLTRIELIAPVKAQAASDMSHCVVVMGVSGSGKR